MGKPIMSEENVETLYDAKFLKLYDMQYAEGKHYFNVSRRKKEDLVGIKTDEDFRNMLPDAVTIAVVIHLPHGEKRLLMSYEYRYPVGQFQLSPVAGLIDPEDREEYLRIYDQVTGKNFIARPQVVAQEGKAVEESVYGQSKPALLSPKDADRLREAYEKVLYSAAVRELWEEAGIDLKPTDVIRVLNPCAFSSPGMTDESNAFLCADVYLKDTSRLNQSGAVGGELFNGFELLDREQAAEIYRTGRDAKGNFFSLAAWAVLGFFLLRPEDDEEYFLSGTKRTP